MEENDLRLMFRMWNDALKEMTYFDNPHLHLSIESPVDCRKEMKYLFAFDIAKDSALYFGNYKIVMQCIGRRDIEGKPVFEEDIIEFYDAVGNLYKKIITWNEELLCYSIGNIPFVKLFGGSFIQPKKDTFKVIGNPYENPKLKEALHDFE
jgi:uncharacterized phage protein (TIGR01671 family)